MIWPHPRLDPLVTITPFSLESAGANFGSYSNNNMGLMYSTSTAWSTANLAVFIPFAVSRRVTIQQVFCLNGATVSGNIDIGIYTLNGTKIVSAGSTAQTGTAAIQALSITPTQLSAGAYYMAMSMDNTTGTIYKNVIYNTLGNRAAGMAQMASAFPLPASATFSAATTGNIPVFALTTRSVI